MVLFWQDMEEPVTPSPSPSPVQVLPPQISISQAVTYYDLVHNTYDIIL